MKKMIKSKIKTIRMCSNCRQNIENSSCTECGTPLISLEEFYCSDWNYLSDHFCKECYIINESNCCPICGGKSFESYGIEGNNNDTIIIFNCYNCKSFNHRTMWTRKKRNRKNDNKSKD